MNEKKIIIKEYKIFRGKLYGLKQSTALLLLANSYGVNSELKVVLNMLLELFEINDKVETEKEFSKYILNMINYIQRDLKIPILCDGKVIYDKKVLNENKILLALPYSSLKALELSFNFIIQAINYLLEVFEDNKKFLERYEILRTNYRDLKNKLMPFALDGINSIRLLSASYKNDIEFKHLVGTTYSYGLGKNSCWMDSTFTNKTSCLGVVISKDKTFTNKVLKDAGFPVPKQFTVNSQNEVFQLLKSELKYPIVIKPTNQDGGLGVFAGLKDKENIKKAFIEASKYSKTIIVEEHIDGLDYRMTVFKGKLIKANLRMPGGVTGDGKHTILELIELAQEHPQIKRRSKEKKGKILSLDEEAISLLKESNLDENRVLEKDKFVQLRRKSNAYTGGLTTLIEHKDIHPDNIDLVERIAKTLDLDIVGIDLLIPDISSSWISSKAAICEVNAQPQVGNSDTPEIYEDILKQLVIKNGKIKIAYYLSDEKGDIKNIDKLFKLENGIGISSYLGNFIGKRQLTLPNNDFYSYSSSMVHDKNIDKALVCTSMKELIQTGFPHNSCDLLIIDNIDMKLYKDDFIKDALFSHVKLFLVNADDIDVLNLTKDISVDRKIFFSKNRNSKEILEHIGKEGKSFYLVKEDSNLYLENEKKELIEEFNKDQEINKFSLIYYSTKYIFENSLKMEIYGK